MKDMNDVLFDLNRRINQLTQMLIESGILPEYGDLLLDIERGENFYYKNVSETNNGGEQND